MPRLIINADDLGVNPQRSHGIFLCFESGIVTNATLIACGSDAEQAAKHAREKELPTGLHLNLTWDSPISKAADAKSLLDEQGFFPGRERQKRALDAGDIDPLHVEREIRAQIEWFLEHHGQQPTHVDGHHHIHVHPFIVPILVSILERYGIDKVRIPCEEPLPPFGFPIPEEQVAFARAISDQAKAARPLFAAHGIASTDHFRGLALMGNASKRNLRHILTKFPEGTTELMVHPGSPVSMGTGFDIDPQRQTEIAMLVDPEMEEIMRERKIERVSYRELV